MIYSFDIFDTCITRACGSPENLFYLLALEFIKDNDRSNIMGFVMDRKRAEQDSYKLSGKECPNIDDIYNLFDTSLYSDADKNTIKQREYELDIESFVPVRKTQEKIRELRSKGRVVFISDMYLSNSLLFPRLVELGVIEETEHLYVSCDAGVSKATGRLFDYVKEKENVRYRDWTHYGDDFHNDYLMPRGKGIKAVRVMTKYSPMEEAWSDEARLMGNRSLSVMTGIFRSIRLQHYVTGGDEFITSIMGAAFVPYVTTLLQDARKRGIERLFFASRDTYLMYLLAKQQSEAFADMELKYLHVSTKVLYPTYISTGSIDEFKYILSLVPSITAGSALEWFCDKQLIEEIGQSYNLDIRLTHDNLRDSLAHELIKENRIRRILNICEQKRKSLQDYLCQEGFISHGNGKVGLVDIGWNCTSQMMLRHLLPNNDISYFYWGVLENRRRFRNTGPFISSIFSEDYNEVVRLTGIVEHYMCRTLEGTTIGYAYNEGIISPVLARVDNSAEQERSVKEMHSIVLELGKWFAAYRKISAASDLFFHSCTLRTLKDFVWHPQYSLIKNIAPGAELSHYSIKKPLFVRLYPWRYIKLLYDIKIRKDGFGQYASIWSFGSIVYTYRGLGEWILRKDMPKKSKKMIKRIIRFYQASHIRSLIKMFQDS